MMRSKQVATVVAFMMLRGIPVAAQEHRVSGRVLDVATERPIQGAVITVGSGERARTTQTDVTGTFAIAVPDAGDLPLLVRRLGYEPLRATLVLPLPGAIEVTLRRIATLDTVRIRAARQGIFGIVAAWGEDMTPLPGATVHVLGETTRRITVDSSARFFVPIRTAGTYVLRATARGYEARTLSITVRANEGTEVALLLDSASGRSNVPLAVAFDDFRGRLMQRASTSALVPRAELGSDPKPRLVDVIRESPSFAKRALRFSEYACVFVDGRARAGLSINAIDPAAVEFVEVYGADGDRSGTLARSWPRGFPCAPTGMIRGAPGRDVVQWVVIWLRH